MLYVVNLVISCFVKLIDLLTNVIFRWIYDNSRKTLPPISNPILLETATSLAYKIRSGQLKSTEVVQSFIDRINEINPILNCVIDTRFDEALAEAAEVDRTIADGQKSAEVIEKETPFLGVPFTTKDSLAIKGCLWTAGLVSRRGVKAEKDCDAVAAVREAGGIPLAVTNVSELCMWMESSNQLYGRTKNSYDTTRMVGGSSGGEGCLQSVGGSPIGIGSDIGGSIRMPAFYNGVFGHKPSRGLVSLKGKYPSREKSAMVVVGPICRYTDDVINIFRILCSSKVNLLNEPTLACRVDLKKINLFYMEDDGGIPLTTPVTAEMKAAQRKVVSYFENSFGLKAQKIKLSQILNIQEMWTTQMSSKDIPTFLQEISANGKEINIYIELLKKMFFCSDHTLPALLLGLFEKFSRNLRKEGKVRRHYVEMVNDFKRDFNEMLGDNGIFLYPSQPKPAPYHNQPILQPFSFLYTAIFNVLEVPVTQCPLGIGVEGLPLGIQVVAGAYNDHLTLSAAAEIEKAFGGWVCPSEVI